VLAARELTRVAQSLDRITIATNAVHPPASPHGVFWKRCGWAEITGAIAMGIDL
jgi:hypothetical protein